MSVLDRLLEGSVPLHRYRPAMGPGPRRALLLSLLPLTAGVLVFLFWEQYPTSPVTTAARVLAAYLETQPTGADLGIFYPWGLFPADRLLSLLYPYVDLAFALNWAGLALALTLLITTRGLRRAGPLARGLTLLPASVAAADLALLTAVVLPVLVHIAFILAIAILAIVIGLVGTALLVLALMSALSDR